MSKEIKEKCKECVYYNERIEYPIVDGTTTHSNCMSIKCNYRKATKDLKIVRLNNKIAYLETKLAEKEGEIEYLKAQRRIYLNRSVEECNKITDLEFELQHKDQDKISFAVEQLEKVKELFESCWDYYFDIGELCNKELFYNKIEQLIAELTHQHEDK